MSLNKKSVTHLFKIKREEFDLKKFLVSTANVYGLDEKDNLLFVGKTMLDSSIETTLANTDVRAGQGNVLQYIYYHTAEMNITITDAQFNLDYIALNVGSAKVTGTKAWTEESVAVTAGAGSVTRDPLSVMTDTIYGWVTKPDGSVERVQFTGKNFTLTDNTFAGTVCVRYYTLEDAGKEVTVNSDMIPAIIHLVMESMLASSDVATNKIGKVEIDVPRASMTGAFTLSMTPDSVASTPLSVRALAYTETSSTGGCSGNRSYYAKIKEIIENQVWSDNVVALAVVGGDFTLATGAKKVLDIRAIPNDGSAAFKPNYKNLTFSATGVTVSSSGADIGTVTGASGGGSVKISVTGKPDVEVTVQVTE